MASATGMGTTVAFGTQTTFTPEIVSVSHNGVTVEDVKTSHMGTTGTHTYIPADLKEGGELSFEVHFLGSQNPGVGNAPESIIVDWSGTGDTWTFSGYIKSFSPSATMGAELMSGTVVVKCAGAVTFNV